MFVIVPPHLTEHFLFEVTEADFGFGMTREARFLARLSLARRVVV
jgi:hypothetical protein